MRAMVLNEICEIVAETNSHAKTHTPKKTEPLTLKEMPIPKPGPADIIIRVSACGVCHTEIDQVEGRIIPPKLPVIPGHQVAGIVSDIGSNVIKFKPGDRAGATWFYSSCKKCRFCLGGYENLCEQFQGTGCNADGGYAEYFMISEDAACKIPESFPDLYHIAPLMCAGVVGYRSLMLSEMENGRTLGLYGFGSANHLVIQMANHLFPDSKKFVITRNPAERELAIELGADWAGDIEEKTPAKLDCAIDTTPVWKPVIFALENLQRGGRLILNLIRKEERDKELLLKLDYPVHLWLEKEIKTVANVTRKDAEEFLHIAARANIKPRIKAFGLEDANKALIELKSGNSPGSKILKIN